MANRFKGKNKYNPHILTHRKRKQQQQQKPKQNNCNVLDQDLYYINDNQDNSV